MTEELKARIAQINAGTAPAGYKKTKVGIVPEEWEISAIGKHLVEYRELSNDIEQYPVYSSSRKGLIPQSDYYDKDAVQTNLGYKMVPIGFVTYRHMSDDDIFHFNINATGGTILVSAEYPVFTAKPTASQYFIITSLNETARFRYFCRTQKLGGTRTRLYFSNLSKYKLALPNLPEQQKIAEILTAQDSVISLLQKRIELKQQQKKALMQKLLSGEVRVGSGEWKTTRLDDLCSTYSGGTPSRSNPEYYNGNIKWIKSGELNNPFIYDTEESITQEGLENSSAKIVEPDTLLIAMYGATAGVIAFSKIRAAINQAILALVPKTEINIIFLKNALQNQIQIAVAKLTQGGQPNFNAGIIGSFEINCPPLPEQEKIAEILTAQDKEIELLQQQLALEQQKKKALMQLLLTGKVRCK